MPAPTSGLARPVHPCSGTFRGLNGATVDTQVARVPSPIKSFPSVMAPRQVQADPLRQALQYAEPSALAMAAFILEQEEVGNLDLEAHTNALLSLASTNADAPASGDESMPCMHQDGPLLEGMDCEELAQVHEDNAPPKKKRKKETQPRTGNAKACAKTLRQRHHQLEAMISRADATGHERCCDMVAHIYRVINRVLTNRMGMGIRYDNTHTINTVLLVIF
jgi:hypothetical protein